jgi:hypothetical protein
VERMSSHKIAECHDSQVEDHTESTLTKVGELLQRGVENKSQFV